MKSPSQERIRALVGAAEAAMMAAGYEFTRLKSKWYSVKTAPDAASEVWILRTSTERDIGFAHKGEHWPTLDNEKVDKVLIAAFDAAKGPRAIVVYPPIARTDLRERFVKAHNAWRAASPNALDDPRVFVKLDKRESTATSDVASGITEGMAPIASYPLEPNLLPGDAAAPEAGLPAADAKTDGRGPPRGKSSISMVIELDKDEHAELAARYARKLEVDPRRLLVEVRLTVLT